MVYSSGIEDVLDHAIPDILRSSPAIGEIPAFISYGFIHEIFGMESRHYSGWPVLSAIIPDRTLRNSITRPGTAPMKRKGGEASMDQGRREKLEASIAEVVERIREGELLQTVISNRFDLQDFDAPGLLEYMIMNDRSRYVYYYRISGREIIGSSPESVFVRNGEEVTIHPIAGTRKYVSGQDENIIASLTSDSKELCEHRMLVDLARNDLSRISMPGSVRVARNMVPERFYSVIHLTSIVNGTLRPGAGNYSIFSSIFPAGTVSGAPKQRALEIIDRYEPVSRGPYAGAVGVIGRNTAEMALAIRTAFRTADESYIQAGAGIVKDSAPAREADEMIAKANTLMAGGLQCA